MTFSQHPQTPPLGMTLFYEPAESSAVLQADETTILRVPSPGDAFPTDRYSIGVSNGTGSGPRVIVFNLTRSQLRRLALNILDAIG